MELENAEYVGHPSFEGKIPYLRRRVVIKFLVFSFGIFLTFGAYTALLSLQSSINIEDGVGMKVFLFVVLLSL